MQRNTAGLGLYWHILKKGKGVIIGGTLFLMAATALISFLLSPVYEASGIIEVGVLYPFPEQGVKKDHELIEEPMAVVAVLGSDEFLDTVRKELGLDSTLEKLRKRLVVEQVVELTRFQRSESTLIRLTCEDNQPETCVKAIDLLGSKLIEQHLRLYSVAMKAFSDRIAGSTRQVTSSQEIITTQKQYQGSMKQRLTEVESDIADFEETIREIDFGKANMNELLFFKATLNSLKEQLLATEMESNAAEKIIGEQEEIIREARKEIANIEGYVGLSRNTELRTRPILPDEPVRPEKTLNIIVATLLGLLITTSYVFLAHYVRQEE